MNKMGSRRSSLVNQKRQRNLQTCTSTIAKFFRKHRRSILTGVLLMVLLILLYGIVIQLPAPVSNTTPQGVTPIQYNAFVGQVEAGNMQAVTIQGNTITGTLARTSQGQLCAIVPAVDENYPFASMVPVPPIDQSCTVYTRNPARGYVILLPKLLSHHVIVKTLPTVQSFDWENFFGMFLPAILIVLVILFYQPFTRMTPKMNDDQASKFLKSRAHISERSARDELPEREAPDEDGKLPVSVEHPVPRVTFADVAGIDEVRSELEEIVQFLREPGHFDRLGAHIPRGVLLVGPPGSGKTLLAKAVAGEANVPFFHMSASEFVEMFVGVGASRVRDLFARARQSAPCVVLIDEIDAVGHKRSLRLHDSGERDQTLNQLLVELDGFDSRNAVIVLAATNRLDILDMALLRPGRFDRQLHLALPDRRGREAILRVHTRHVPLSSEVCLDELARLTTGMSGADLANLVNEAALYAARHDLENITSECFGKALVRIQLGALRSLVIGKSECRIIAFHESGHALVAHYLPQADSVSRISILPYGQRLGVTCFTPRDDHCLYSRAYLMARIAVGLGGHIAEELTFGPDGVTTGAEDDIQAVTSLAWRMVTHWGMGGQMGVIYADYPRFGGEALPRSTHAGPITARYMSSPGMEELIENEVQRILQDARATACGLLTEHYGQLTKLAEMLIQYEQLDRSRFEVVLKA